MLYFMKSFSLIAAIMVLIGCSKQTTSMKSQSNYNSKRLSAPPRQEVSKSKVFQFDNAEVIGYLDNPTPSYIIDTDKTYAKQASMKNSSGKIDNELEKLKIELEAEFDEEPRDKQIVETQQVQPEQKQMITYDGVISSRSTKPDSLIAIAVAFAESVKGYVEVQNNNSVTLRIPVVRFGNVYDSLLKMGDVIDYLRTAEDITDAFRDTELRLMILQKTIERYVNLLNLVKEEKSKIVLLKEIGRLREELEGLRVQKSKLAIRAAYGTIQYSVEYVTSGFAGIRKLDNIQGFEWITYLDPNRVDRIGKKLKLESPEGMVELKNRDFWISQSPAGTRVWTAQVSNGPQGTSDFWIDAIACKMRNQFLTVDTSTCSDYRFIRCVPLPGINYRYMVGVKVVGKSVQIIQCFFPDEMQENRYFDSIKKILMTEGGAS